MSQPPTFQPPQPRPQPDPDLPDPGRLGEPGWRPPKKRRTGLIVALVVIVGLLVFGSCVAGLASLGSAPAPGSKPIEPAAAGSPSSQPTTEWSTPAAPETTINPEQEIEKSDIQLKVKITSKQCFGSAGCNVEYKIKASVDRTGWPKDGTLDVTYKVTGDESGPIKDTLTMDLDEGTFEQSSYQSASTRAAGVQLKVKVTDLEYSEW